MRALLAHPQRSSSVTGRKGGEGCLLLLPIKLAYLCPSKVRSTWLTTYLSTKLRPHHKMTYNFKADDTASALLTPDPMMTFVGVRFSVVFDSVTPRTVAQ